MKAAVVLMAYGSPERLTDVPAYYADIRGGRPIAPENLADLVERYRRLGIEDSSPLNAVTEETRAALEHELGMPVYAGMKHWHPFIADVIERMASEGVRHIVAVALAPHYSKISIGGYHKAVDEAPTVAIVATAVSPFTSLPPPSRGARCLTQRAASTMTPTIAMAISGRNIQTVPKPYL